MIASASMVLPTPTLLMVIGAGSNFNPSITGIAAAMGATVGDSFSYSLGISGQGMVANKACTRVEAWMRRYGWITLFFLAVVPNPLLDIGGIIAGVLRIPMRRFLLAVLAGHTLKFLVAAHLGSSAIGLLNQLANLTP
jgi:membrane protein DedA with SNARE-associated domain